MEPIGSKGLIRIDDKNDQEISLLQIVAYNNKGLCHPMYQKLC